MRLYKNFEVPVHQGIGFRPYIYNLATRYSLSGFVQNNILKLLKVSIGEKCCNFRLVL
ncbi:MAG TPA: acylphosphatase [Candidatus Wunengus sp. YC60]|uniref:acylphosphatase n=1 Tax=Candidatus Wunengus sp. YC60 TaxID=3367697 RepID=UPI004024DC60